MDALKQDLICEFHAEDRVYDCTFLHDWDMFAAAQNKYLHIYDSQGTELHCMRTIRKPRFLEFLPYHYLLVSISDYGIIDYLDVSTAPAWRRCTRPSAAPRPSRRTRITRSSSRVRRAVR